ncbi:MAG: rhamnulokinase, partial [Actinobacteria bacterium]|nr:rhamnulokinase [Actinomycetota bacterium]
MAGTVAGGTLELAEVHRFPNPPVTVSGTLHWDILRLFAEISNGLAAASRRFDLASIGIDSWGVDYGLLDSSGALLGNPVHYRDRRTDGAAERVLRQVPASELYAVTGIQQLPFNTIYQLAAAAGTPQLAAARTLLLIPDLLAYWLTGEAGAEVTNASTTGLYDVTARDWARPLMRRIGITPGLFPPLRQPGEVIGALLPEVARDLGLAGPGRSRTAPVPVTAVGSHDTASAVAAVPAAGPGFAYISCGTWSLVGTELDRPVLTEASRAANFTNETGVDGTIRYLRNVMGLWLLQESQRSWAEADAAAGAASPGLDALLAEAGRLPPRRFLVDPDDPAFLPPGDIPARIAAACRERGRPAPGSRAETVRCILDSLALAHARAVTELQDLSDQQVSVVHMVGGGSRNELLCQLTADACGLPVVAGPAEATAIGNILVQARSAGAAPGDLAGLR